MQHHPVIYIQPQVQLAGNIPVDLGHQDLMECYGGELLTRFRDPQTQALLPPLPIIQEWERTNHPALFSLAYQQIMAACALAREFHKRFKKRIVISVNVSPVQVARDDQLLSEVAQRVAEAAIPPWQICIEITEKTIRHSGRFLRNVERLSTYGIKLSLDDFGMGHTVARMQQIGQYVSCLKIDKALITPVPDEVQQDVNDSIIIGLIAMARARKKRRMSVCAEGLEDNERANWFLNLVYGAIEGNHPIQGYLVAKPMPLSEFWTWAEKSAYI